MPGAIAAAANVRRQDRHHVIAASFIRNDRYVAAVFLARGRLYEHLALFSRRAPGGRSSELFKNGEVTGVAVFAPQSPPETSIPVPVAYRPRVRYTATESMLVARQMLFAITGRMKKPAVKKLNPIWWFGNDDEQQTADWYHPEWPRWRRDFYWNFLRNPLQNFRCFVIGVQDRNYTVTGRAPVMTVQRDDLGPPERGFQWCVIHTLIPLGFLSYSGKHVVWYIGWQPSGIFGVKFNLH